MQKKMGLVKGEIKEVRAYFKMRSNIVAGTGNVRASLCVGVCVAVKRNATYLNTYTCALQTLLHTLTYMSIRVESNEKKRTNESNEEKNEQTFVRAKS